MASTEISFIPDFDQLDQDIQDEDFETTVNVGGTGGGGGMSPSQRNQQEGIIAGGVSKGLLGIGIFTAILSQLKSVTAIVDAVFGSLSRALIPIIEEVADFIRPFVQQANQLAQTGERPFQRTGQALFGGNTSQDIERVQRLIGDNTLSFGERSDLLLENPALENLTDAIIEGLGGKTLTPDQTGEASKRQIKDNNDSVQADKAGNFE